MNFTIGRAARLDIENIAGFYARERRELAARFIEELDRALLLLGKRGQTEFPSCDSGTNHRRSLEISV